MNCVLETERLLLRPVEEADVPAFVRLLADFSVAKNLATVPHPYTERDGLNWLAGTAAKGELKQEFAFGVVLKLTNTYIGCCRVHQERGFEFGYWLGVPYWGIGYATEAGRRVVRFAFDELGPERLWASYMYDNPASGRVLTKLGFVHTNDLMAPCLARGNDVLRHRMVLTREHFENVSLKP